MSGTGLNIGETSQGLDYGPTSAAFTILAGTDIAHHKSLCLLYSISNWENTWIIDTGASDHICHSKSLFINLKALDKPYRVTLLDGKGISQSLIVVLS